MKEKLMYVGTYLNEPLHKRLKTVAKTEGRSMSKQVARIIEEWLNGQEKEEA